MKLLILTQKVNKNDPILGFFHRWIIEFSRHCEQVIVICLEQGEFDLPNNVKVLSLGKEIDQSRIKYLWRFYKYIWQERKNYEKVFVHMNQIYVILGGLFWRLTGKKIGLWYVHRQVSLSLKVATFLANIIFSATKESFNLKTKKLTITGHGIDVENFKQDNYLTTNKYKGVFVIGSIGRITPTKNILCLIKTLKLLPEKLNFLVNIYGVTVTSRDEIYLQQLKKSIYDLNLTNLVLFRGKVLNQEVPKIISTFDVFLNLSKTNSLDKAVLEAMAGGALVITSNEAYRNILSPYPFLYTKLEPISISNSIEIVHSLSVDHKKIIISYFQKFVTEHHSLKKLIPKVIYSLN